ncbi:F-box protein At5g49610 [Lolium perenne]|uniref:F-box protein At5g49610 n=1 Tax=Lolium perenne TaxID=4522 RepID=UPI003A98D3E1
MSTESEQCHGGGGGTDDDSLPEDQMFELLTRVSLDDLAACRQVSAQWRRLTYEPAFGPQHCRCRADAVVSGYFVQGMARNRYSATFVSMTRPSSSSPPVPPVSLDFLPCAHVRVEAVSAHRGLACCVDADARVGGKASSARCYYACKPATRQWLALPNPRLRFPTAATAMVARPAGAGAAADFKILRLSVATLRDRLRCEIFDSRRGAWRRSAEVMLWPESLVAAGPATRVHGAMHWLRWPDSLTGASDIFAFDMKSETWRLIGLPPEVGEDRGERWATKKLMTVEGKLCLAVIEDEEAAVWVIDGYGRQQERWEKKMAVSLKGLAVNQGRDLVLRDLCSSEVAFFNSVYRVIWYDFWKGKVVEVPVHHKCIHEVFKYESDLDPWDIDENKI